MCYPLRTLFLTFCLLLPTSLAFGLERIALTSNQENFVTAQLDGELRTLGYDVVSLEAPPDTGIQDPTLLRTVAARADAEAMLIVTGETSSLTVVIAVFGPSTRVILRNVSGIKAEDEGLARVAALRVVEILRAELSNRPETYTPAKEKKKETPPQPIPPPPQHLWHIHATPALGWWGSDFQFLPLMRFGVSRRWFSRWAFVFDATSMILPRQFDVSTGDITTWAGTTSAGIAWIPGGAYWSFPMEARVGVGVTYYQGVAQPPHEGRGGLLVSPMGEVRLGVQRLLWDHLHLRAGVSVQTLGIGHRVFADGDVAMQWGQLNGVFDLGVTWSFGEAPTPR